jgi:hypothetical protein
LTSTAALLQVTATDADAGDTLAYSLLRNTVEQRLFDDTFVLQPTTGLLQPTQAAIAITQTTVFQGTAIVTDSAGLTDIANITVTVTIPNLPPRNLALSKYTTPETV